MYFLKLHYPISYCLCHIFQIHHDGFKIYVIFFKSFIVDLIFFSFFSKPLCWIGLLSHPFLVPLIVDLCFMNHPKEVDGNNDEFIDHLNYLGDIMDELPINHELILALSDAEYYSAILKASNVHKVMFDLLIEQFNIMIESNMK